MDPNTRKTTTNAIFFITGGLTLLSDEMNVRQCLTFVQIYTKKRYFKKKISVSLIQLPDFCHP